MRILASGYSSTRITRTDSKSLGIEQAHGFFTSYFDKIYRDKAHPFKIGQTVKLPRMTVEIRSLTKNQHPLKVRLTFDVALEDTSLKFIQFKDGEYTHFQLPEIGKTIYFPAAVSFFGWR